MPRPGRSRRGKLALGAAVAVVLAGAVVVASVAPASRSADRKLPVAQFVAISRHMLRGLGDRHVTTASVIATTLNAAENVTSPGSVPPDAANRRAYLVMVRGRFICSSCPTPAGAKPPRGRFAYSIWVPDRGSAEFGLVSRAPRRLGALGAIINLPLTAPR